MRAAAGAAPLRSLISPPPCKHNFSRPFYPPALWRAFFGLHDKGAAGPGKARARKLIPLVALPHAAHGARRQLVEDAGVRCPGGANNGAGGAGVNDLNGAGAPAVIHALLPPVGAVLKNLAWRALARLEGRCTDYPCLY